MCEHCGGGIERVALMGTMLLTRCSSCGHQQLVRAQAPRGVRWRNGEAEHVVQVSGEIEVRR